MDKFPDLMDYQMRVTRLKPNYLIAEIELIDIDGSIYSATITMFPKQFEKEEE